MLQTRLSMPLEAKIRRTLAVVRAALQNPNVHPLREVNASAIELLDEIDPWTLLPQERSDLADLTLALRRLRYALASNDRS